MWLLYPSPSFVIVLSPKWYRILYLFSIGFAFRLTLRFRLTLGWLPSPRNPLVFGVRVSHSHYRVLMSASSLPFPPTLLPDYLLRFMERSSTDVYLHPQASVIYLAPLYFRRKSARLVSYYAFFKGWLLLSQLPNCLGSFTSFST